MRRTLRRRPIEHHTPASFPFVKGRLHASLLLLAGGKGSRMGGRNKLYLELGGSPLIERLLRSLAPIFSETLLLVAKGESSRVRECFAPLLDRWGVSLAEDREEGRGPLEGLCSGLAAMREERAFLLGCDMPMPQEDVIRGMYSFCFADTDAVVAEIDGFLEPLHAFYSRRCLPQALASSEHGCRKIKDFYNDIRLTIIKEETLSEYGDYRNSFLNLNTPRDISAIKLCE